MNSINNIIPNSHKIALTKLAGLLNKANVSWVLTGSTNLALQGVDIEVGDIDIIVESDQIYGLNDILKDYVETRVTFSTSNSIRSKYGIFMIDGVQVEAMADLEVLKDGEWQKGSPPDFDKCKKLEVDSYSIKLLSLEEEYRGYMRMDRTEKAAKIKAKLPKKSAIT